MNKISVINEYKAMNYELIEQHGKQLVFRKKFSVGWLIFWLIMGGFGAIFYVLYHYAKPKKFVKIR